MFFLVRKLFISALKLYLELSFRVNKENENDWVQLALEVGSHSEWLLILTNCQQAYFTEHRMTQNTEKFFD